MTITINSKLDIEAELARQAGVRGMDVPVYAASLLEQAAKLPQSCVDRDLEEFDKSLDCIAQFSDKIAGLPEFDLSRGPTR